MTITDASKLAGIHVNTGSRLAKKVAARVAKQGKLPSQTGPMGPQRPGRNVAGPAGPQGRSTRSANTGPMGPLGAQTKNKKKTR